MTHELFKSLKSSQKPTGNIKNHNCFCNTARGGNQISSVTVNSDLRLCICLEKYRRFYAINLAGVG